MKFFVDSGNLDEIRKLVPLGIVDGVTTNPSLLAKEPRDATDIIKDICKLVQGPVSYEVVSTDAKGMIAEGRKLAAVDPHVVVKAPFTTAGVEATRALSSEGIKVNVTLCFSPTQALIAAKVGAAYISPFIGRLDDIATDGLELVRQIIEIYHHYNFRTEVLVASVRHPMHIVQAARMGADVCTCPPAVLEACFKHPLTDIGLEKFLKDWNKAQESQKLEVKSQK
jgi:transaldolase